MVLNWHRIKWHNLCWYKLIFPQLLQQSYDHLKQLRYFLIVLEGQWGFLSLKSDLKYGKAYDAFRQHDLSLLWLIKAFQFHLLVITTVFHYYLWTIQHHRIKFLAGIASFTGSIKRQNLLVPALPLFLVVCDKMYTNATVCSYFVFWLVS